MPFPMYLLQLLRKRLALFFTMDASCAHPESLIRFELAMRGTRSLAK